MKLHVITLALDAMPFITRHLKILEDSGVDFHWHIIEGTSANNGSTRWCKAIPPRLSRDGTTDYLNSLVGEPRVTLYRRQFWRGGKDEMVNMPLARIKEQSVLMQIDADEIWQPSQLKNIVEHFDGNLLLDQMGFICRYFVGQDIVINIENEMKHGILPWVRAWRFQPGMRFHSHEPPVLMPHPRRSLSPHETIALGLIFDHFSYVTEAQVAFKETFYGYANAVAQWKCLQENTVWPVKVKKYLPWSGPNSIAERIKNPPEII